MWHDFLLSQRVKKRLRSRKLSGMLRGRPAAGVHRPLLECQWRNEGGCGRGFPMGVRAGVQRQARRHVHWLQLCKALPRPVEARQELEVRADCFEVTCCGVSALALAEVSPVEIFNFCKQFLLKWGPSVHTSYLFSLSAKMKARQSFACVPFLQWHFTEETHLGDCYRHFRHGVICLFILALYFNT